ncbi:efflux RND transporter permease subunit [Ignatzschineria cameli]|uniref:Efflux pump membrane transporter n=1 Tax=Ignatzschineria cameli TaxID=2182793 RepID=A0A2U2ARF2_9GAMM|nr:efflux RND transporter permease subunit [Ignatzschineria cameli]PWD86843.1 hydrophobe/amphiphile efflux-1 family RND transporter [Ignatzschineria cameli]PWD91817.1 hydrophobe/amphiphile efflux-1 family RND transporter [Ignatzschineria cameli]PWD93597.1 hydrophobe/amphiphile efflux-1 family RND transporter [Ignatzschineria cameli]PWD94339.1 hydrophobe/amphiphile efflux-1 family RND transporter [Ignatzschineria cameli]
MARFFIDRPIFAWVLAILTMFIGLLVVRNMAVSQYPPIAPPQISISGVYPGASAQTVEESVTQVIEQSISGLDGYRYMNSASSSSGTFQITVTFNQGVDPDLAQVQVQNKIQQSLSKLPQAVQQQGVTIAKTSGSFLLVVGFYSPDGTMSSGDIGDYISSTLEDQMSRIEGVGEIQFFGSSYAMNIWLDPIKLYKYNMTPTDVVAAIKEQNSQATLGALGAMPAVQDQLISYTVTSQSLLQSPEEFKAIQLRVNEDGSEVLLSDVARVELSPESEAVAVKYNNSPAAGLAVSLASGANALDTATSVKKYLEKISVDFPSGLAYTFPYDTTPFVEYSVASVEETLIDAIILVFVVVFFFLKNIRATIIPMLAIPYVLAGTMLILDLLGFNLNTLTLFALVLAIGLLVDDAIVVVENVERIMEEEKVSPLEATRRSMDQITGALIGIGVVLSAVFVPMAFLGGATGVIYRQFSVTIITAMLLSVIVAIIFTPAMCATLLRDHKEHHVPKTALGRFFQKIFAPFNHVIGLAVKYFNIGFDKVSDTYTKTIAKVLKHPIIFVVLLIVGLGAIGYQFMKLPKSFLPDEDQGILIGMTINPNGTSLNQTEIPLEVIADYLIKEEQQTVESVMTVAGFSFSGQGSEQGMFFVKLRPWADRESASESIPALVDRLQKFFTTIPEAQIFVFSPPPIIELGTATGVSFQLQDTIGLGHDTLMNSVMKFIGLAATSPDLDIATLRPGGQFDTAQYHVDIDREKAQALQVSVGDINTALSIAWGGMYVNDFIDRGRVKHVQVKADAPYRMMPDDFNRWYVRNAKGEMVPFSAFAKGRWSYGPPQLNRFDGFASFPLSISAASGKSTGEAMDAIEALVREHLPQGINVAWTDTSYEEQEAGNSQVMLLLVSVFVIFLSLAALYESWKVPISVLLTIPVGVVGSVVTARLFGIENDVYFQVGLLTTIGLTSKNAILIVEFARDLVREGMSTIDATIRASQERLRPIVMTSLAFGFGVMPLALSTGAGAGAQNVVGRIVVGGMIGGTLLVLLYTPVFYILLNRDKKKRDEAGDKSLDQPLDQPKVADTSAQ